MASWTWVPVSGLGTLGNVRPQDSLLEFGVHVQGPGINTLYSDLMDLRGGIIYLYYWHQYGAVVTLDMAKELAKAAKPTPLRDLFSRSTVEQAEKERRNYAGRGHSESTRR